MNETYPNEDNIIRTKIIPPPLKRRVERERLYSQLDEGLRAKLTLISSPAGFGKTTLLRSWTEIRDFKYCWINLDKYDNSAGQLIDYICAGFRIKKRDENLSDIINHLVTITDTQVLVLDDYHLAENPEINDFINSFIRLLPENIHIYILTRIDPSIGLSRLRGRAELVEIRAADLQFTIAESKEFLERFYRLSLDPKELRIINDRMEGWISGLQMAAASMQKNPGPGHFIKKLSANNKFVLDYLLQEVLSYTDSDLREFLFSCSILERMCADLCDAVCRRNDSMDLLEYIEKNNLFIIPLDDNREWYRFHHLFIAFLQSYLDKTRTINKNELHIRAAEWFEKNDYYIEAIDNYMASAEYDQAARLIESRADHFLMNSEIKTVMRWIADMPADPPGEHPLIDIINAWTALFNGKPIKEINEKLVRIEKGPYKSMSTSMRALIAVIQGKTAEGIRYARQASEKIPDRYRFLKGFSFLTEAIAKVFSGKIDEAFSLLENTAQRSIASGNILVAALSFAYQGEIHLYNCSFGKAESLYKRAMLLTIDKNGQRLPAAGAGQQGLGLISWYRGELDEALEYFQSGIESYKNWFGSANLNAYIGLAKTYESLGLRNESDRALNEAINIARSFDATEYDDRLAECARCQILLNRNMPEALDPVISEILSNLSETRESDSRIEFYLKSQEKIIYSRYILEKNKYEECIAVLNSLISEESGAGRPLLILESEILLAMTYKRMGKNDEAYSAIGRAIDRASPEKIIQPFINYGQTMARFLYETFNFKGPDPFMAKILARFPVSDQATAIKKNDDAFGQLTNREIEVIILLAKGLSNKEIASSLFISVRTVKWHASHIYYKLNVNNRTKAIAKARQLGILSDQ